jgi:hypothetical protein
MPESEGLADISANIHWTTKLEDYFASTGEKAHCLSWIHKRAEDLYSRRKTYIDLPVIVLSSMVGFLSVGTSTIFPHSQESANIFLGMTSLFVGVMNTAGSYFGWAKRAEGHRISSIHYAKLYRFIHVEMSLPRDERMTPHDFLRYVKDQYDRLQEVSPLIPASVIQLFNDRFKYETEISKPEEANGLEKIEVYRGEGPNGDILYTPRAPVRQSSDGSATHVNPMFKTIKSMVPTVKLPRPAHVASPSRSSAASSVITESEQVTHVPTKEAPSS